MPDFAYIARNMKGEKISGTLSASSERDAINVLSTKSLFPIDVSMDAPRRKFSFGGRVKGQVMATAYAQMSALLRSGVPLLRSLNVLAEQASNATLKEVLRDVHAKVEDGESMADAMQVYPKVFNDMAVNMVRAGAEGGFLEDALDRVAQFTEQQEDLKARTIGALAYPVFLGSVGSLIVACLIIFFVPKFAPMFDSLRAKDELPMMTDILLGISATLRKWGLLIAAFGGVIGLMIKNRLDTESGKRFCDVVKLKIPLVGGIFQNLAVARFCRVLGTLLHNGVPILKSLDISRDAAGNRVLSEAILTAAENISAGESLASPLKASGYFPTTVVEMISVAEESNSLDTVLVDIADGLEKRTSRRLDLAVRLLEPMMLMVLAGAVLFVVIALLMPVIKMSSTI